MVLNEFMRTVKRFWENCEKNFGEFKKYFWKSLEEIQHNFERQFRAII